MATKLGDQRCAEWPLCDAFHLTSHHLLGFIRLHISVILHHLLQPCLATCHLCRIKGICVVLQDSQLEEGKNGKRVKALSAFTGRWKAELTMSSSSSSLSGHREPKPTPWQPCRACRQLTAFQAPALGRGNAPAFVPKAEMEPSRAEGSPAPPSPSGPNCQHPHTCPGQVPTTVQGCQQCHTPPWHTDALLHTAIFPFPRWRRGERAQIPK